METIIDCLSDNTIETLTIAELRDGIKELNGQPYKYKTKKDMIKYINELINNAINICRNLNRKKANENENENGIYVKLFEKNHREEITRLEQRIKSLNSRIVNMRISQLETIHNHRELMEDYIQVCAENTKLAETKSICVTDDLIELTEHILNKSTSNEIPEGIALELNNKLLEIYKKSKHGSVVAYNINEMDGVIIQDEDLSTIEDLV